MGRQGAHVYPYFQIGGTMAKINAKITTSDVYKYIAKNSDLSTAQVRECFDTYYELLSHIASSKSKSTSLMLAFPRIGNFYFRVKHGRKSGTEYKMPLSGSKETVVVKCDTAEPSYLNLVFRVRSSIRDEVKETSKFYEE